MLVPVAVIQAVGDEAAWLLGNKHRQPFHNSEREIIKPRSLTNLVRFHAGILLETTGHSENRRCESRLAAANVRKHQQGLENGQRGVARSGEHPYGLRGSRSSQMKTAPQQGGATRGRATTHHEDLPGAGESSKEKGQAP